jgi:membrane protein
VSVLRNIRELLVETFESFDADEIPRRAAAISYFMLLALAPILLLINMVVSIAGKSVVGGAASGGAAAGRLAEATSTASAAFSQVSGWAGGYAPYVTLFLVIFGAVSVFGQFVGALQVIWRTPPKRTPLRAFLRQNALAFALLGVTALALFAAIIVGGLIVAFGTLVNNYAALLGFTVPAVAFTLTIRAAFVFVIAVLLFWVAFTVVPDRRVRAGDALPGAAITAGLFTVGELWLSYYLGATQRFSVFGTFEFFVVLIVWIYYSSLVALWGAELTRLLILRFEARREEAAAVDSST